MPQINTRGIAMQHFIKTLVFSSLLIVTAAQAADTPQSLLNTYSQQAKTENAQFNGFWMPSAVNYFSIISTQTIGVVRLAIPAIHKWVNMHVPAKPLSRYRPMQMPAVSLIALRLKNGLNAIAKMC